MPTHITSSSTVCVQRDDDFKSNLYRSLAVSIKEQEKEKETIDRKE